MGKGRDRRRKNKKKAEKMKGNESAFKQKADPKGTMTSIVQAKAAELPEGLKLFEAELLKDGHRVKVIR